MNLGKWLLADRRRGAEVGGNVGQLARATLLLMFLGLGLWTAMGGARPTQRLRINIFIAYTLVLSFGAGIFQRDVWPFSTWPLIAGRVPTPVIFPRFVALDARGREHAIDYRAWHPFEFDEVMAWRGAHFARLDPKARDQAAAYWLERIEAARVQWQAGHPVYLGPMGPLSAPLFLGHPALWSNPAAVPDRPLVGLRLYEERWDVEERARDPSAVYRKVIYEYRTQ